jgi:hypothetical protein
MDGSRSLAVLPWANGEEKRGLKLQPAYCRNV